MGSGPQLKSVVPAENHAVLQVALRAWAGWVADEKNLSCHGMVTPKGALSWPTHIQMDRWISRRSVYYDPSH